MTFLLVTDVTPGRLLRGAWKPVFRACAAAEAQALLSRGGRRIQGVVWHLTGSASVRQAAAAARECREIPFIGLGGATSERGRTNGALRQRVAAPVEAALLAGIVRREALLMQTEARLREARAQGRSHARRLAVLSHISQAANSVLEPRKVMEIVMSRAQELIGTEAWTVLLLDEKEQTLSLELKTEGRGETMKDLRVRLGEGIPGWVAQIRKPLIVNDVRQERRFDGRLHLAAGLSTRSVLCTPLISRGRIIGAVELINKRRGQFTPEDLEMVTTLVEPGAIALENAILYQKSAELTVTDDLTKLFNSRYLNVHLKREIKRSRRYGMPVSLIFLDLDGFKYVNDNYGHLAGSRALFEVGQVLQETVREIDVVSRYGGDEFTIILPQTGAAGAMVIADRIRLALEERVFLADLGLRVRLTASFGVSTFPDHGQSREELIQGADQAMYLVKDRGKNGVALALQATVSEKGRI